MNSPCPICKKPVTEGRPKNPNAPFCSGRCKSIDLARWLGGDYTIPVKDEVPSESDLATAMTPPLRS